MENKVAFGHLACLMAYLIFGFNIVICKDITNSQLISPITLFTFRALGAGLLFWLVSFFLPTEKVDKGDYIKIFAASMLGLFSTQVSFLFAIERTTPFDASIISTLSPIFTMFIAAVVLKEPITLKKAGGVALSFLGVFWLIYNSLSRLLEIRTSEPIGIILMFCNCLSFALYLGVFKKLIGKYSVVTFMKWSFLFSLIVAFPFSAKEVFNMDYISLPNNYILELAYLIICSTFFAYFLIPYGQKRLRPTLVSMYSYTQPIIATVTSVILGMDVITWHKVLAAVAVFAGVILVNKSRAAK